MALAARILLLSFTLLLSACATAPTGAVPATVWDDGRFAAPSVRIDPAEVMALSPAMRRYLAEEFPALRRRMGPRDALAYALGDAQRLMIEYDAEHTRNAAETFEARAGNCLSLVVMAVAFARELGLGAQVNDVAVAPDWSLSEHFVQLSGHVNVTLTHGPQVHLADRMVIDFVPMQVNRTWRSTPISDARLVALFMNNRAVEAMARNEPHNAYAYLKSALQVDPSYSGALNTLGVLYRRVGAPALAERAWVTLIAMDARQVHAMANLEQLLRAQGRAAEAKLLAQRMESERDRAPFVAYAQGLVAAQRGDWEVARRAFERELRVVPQYHELHLWLARTYVELGERRAAAASLARAEELAPTRDLRRRYHGKLEALRRLQAS